MVGGNRQALEKRLNKGEAEINEALARLGEALGTYGFKGQLSLTLDVVVKDDFEEKAHITRTASFGFRR